MSFAGYAVDYSTLSLGSDTTDPSTTAADSSNSGGFLSGVNDLFSTVGNVISSTYKAVSTAQAGPAAPPGYYKTPTGTIAPLPAAPTNMNAILILGLVIVGAVLVMRTA